MKTFYVHKNIDGCWYYRAYLPAFYNGWDADRMVLGDLSPIDRQMSALKAQHSDIVVFQRPDEKERIQSMKLFKAMGKKIVFENDDTYKKNDHMKFREEFKRRSGFLDEAIALADLCTTTTEFLADEYRKINPNVVVLPNQIEPDDWPEPERNETDVVRIGLFGSTTMNGDYEGIEDALGKLCKRKDVKIVVLGAPDPDKIAPDIKHLWKEEINFWSRFNIEGHQTVHMHDVFSKLNSLKLDMVLIPRKDNYFNRCKSNVKFLESSMLEIPVIAQGFEDGLSPYQGEGDRDYQKIVIGDNWLEPIEELIADKELRRKMGREAKEYVIENYNIQDSYKRWDEAFNKLIQ